MASRPPLRVWLYGFPIATLKEPQYGKFRLDFNPELQGEIQRGSSLLSMSMRFDPETRPRGDLVRSWFDALLPEGEARSRVARALRVPVGDDYRLLSLIGRECAGAVVLQPVDEDSPSSREVVSPLDDDELEALIRNLANRPLGIDGQMRVSLAGMQEKLLLARLPDGRLGRPIDGTPSTLILKPQDQRFIGYSAAEAYCLGIARHLGLTTVSTEMLDIAGRPTIAVSRYDREVTEAGVIRIHQEDATQALGVDLVGRPERKYEAHGGPGLREVAQALRSLGQERDLTNLLALTALNVIIGNADCHARNLSILHRKDGTTELAPAYDLTPTTFYRGIPTPDGPRDMSDELGMFIAGKRSIHALFLQDIVDEGVSWGMRARQASELVEKVLTDTRTYIEASDVALLPPAIVDFFLDRLDALQGGRLSGADDP